MSAEKLDSLERRLGPGVEHAVGEVTAWARDWTNLAREAREALAGERAEGDVSVLLDQLADAASDFGDAASAFASLASDLESVRYSVEDANPEVE